MNMLIKWWLKPISCRWPVLQTVNYSRVPLLTNTFITDLLLAEGLTFEEVPSLLIV